MTAQQTDGWAQRYDRAAGEQVQDVVAAAQFMRPRGWKAFGHALADGPVGLMQRALGRPRQVRLPEAVLVAVSDGSVHLLSARTRPGGGPVPYPTRSLAAWPRTEIDVDASPVHDGTRLMIAPHDGPAVELYAPPDALTARVVQVLTGSEETAAAGTEAATEATASEADARELAAARGTGSDAAARELAAAGATASDAGARELTAARGTGSDAAARELAAAGATASDALAREMAAAGVSGRESVVSAASVAREEQAKAAAAA